MKILKSNYSKEIAQYLINNRTETFQGYCYKDYDFIWETGNPDTIIYVPEYGFTEHESNWESITPDIANCYTKIDFIDIAGSRAKELFGEVDWQYPETLYDEWDDELNEGEGFAK